MVLFSAQVEQWVVGLSTNGENGVESVTDVLRSIQFCRNGHSLSSGRCCYADLRRPWPLKISTLHEAFTASFQPIMTRPKRSAARAAPPSQKRPEIASGWPPTHRAHAPG